MIVAVDGPAGSGKGTVTKRIEEELGFLNLDTGATYRCVALQTLREGLKLENEKEIIEIANNIDIKIDNTGDKDIILLNGEDVSGQIRTEEVGNMASKSSALPCVREKLLELQQKLARENDVVMDGRDIGTNILPDAQLKIYLTASVDTRANRRYKELLEKGTDCDLEEIKKDIEQRDYQDMHREIAPLRQAADAVYLDSSDLTIDQVVEKIKSLAK